MEDLRGRYNSSRYKVWDDPRWSKLAPTDLDSSYAFPCLEKCVLLPYSAFVVLDRSFPRRRIAFALFSLLRVPRYIEHIAKVITKV